jgi:hypothetical protein
VRCVELSGLNLKNKNEDERRKERREWNKDNGMYSRAEYNNCVPPTSPASASEVPRLVEGHEYRQ